MAARRRHPRAAAIALATPVRLALSGFLLAGSAAAQSSDVVLAELTRVCEEQRRSGPYAGEEVVEQLESQYQTAAAYARPTLALPLAYHNLRIGRPQRALEILQDVLPEETPSDGNQRGALHLAAMAHLVLAEDLNCLAGHTSASCLLPIRPAGVHREPAHARAAGDALLRLLQSDPEDPSSRWLLHLARMLSGDYPEGVPEALRAPALAPASVAVQPGDAVGDMPHLIDVGSRLGLERADLAGGALLDDFDGDGRLDLISSAMDSCAPLQAFRNTGDGFEDVSASWGLSSQLGGLNLVHADADNDGDLDILVLRGAWLGDFGRMRNSLLRNDLNAVDSSSSGTFVDVTHRAGLANPAYPTQTAAWADFDLDGDLDLFVGNESPQGTTDPLQLDGSTPGFPSQLFLNRGNGTFRDVARNAGVQNLRYAKGVAWGDYDDDGDPDLYISNVGPNRLYENRGDGSFRDVAVELGVEAGDRRTFATWWFDFDNDGRLDLFVADYHAEVDDVARSLLGEQVEQGHPWVFRNTGDGFEDVSGALGLDAPLLPMGANFGDLDGDGWLDVYLATGSPAFSALMPNVLYRNEGGRRLRDATYRSGLGHLQKGHGVAFGDVDNDGDLDLFHELGGAFPYDGYPNALFVHPGQEYRWLVLRFAGRNANRFALGARVRIVVLESGRERSLYRVVGSGGSFGGSSLQLEVGLGSADTIRTVEVDWPGSGLHQSFAALQVDHAYRLVEGVESAEPISYLPLRFDLSSPTHQH